MKKTAEDIHTGLVSSIGDALEKLAPPETVCIGTVVRVSIDSPHVEL